MCRARGVGGRKEGKERERDGVPSRNNYMLAFSFSVLFFLGDERRDATPTRARVELEDTGTAFINNCHHILEQQNDNFSSL